jgi:hypothetical protein
MCPADQRADGFLPLIVGGTHEDGARRSQPPLLVHDRIGRQARDLRALRAITCSTVEAPNMRCGRTISPSPPNGRNTRQNSFAEATSGAITSEHGRVDADRLYRPHLTPIGTSTVAAKIDDSMNGPGLNANPPLRRNCHARYRTNTAPTRINTPAGCRPRHNLRPRIM